MLRIEVAGRTIWQMIGAILLTLLFLRVAASASGLLSMVALSFFFSLALDPAVWWLCHRYDWRRGAAVGVIYLTGVVFVGFMVFILIPAIRELAARIAESGDEWIAQLNAWTSANAGLPLDADVASGVVGAGEAVGGFAIQGLIPGVIVLAYALVYQQVENYVLSPRISADTMALNGGVAFGAALAGGAIAGPVGAFVALPVAALISASVANYARSYEVVYRSQYDEVQDADDDPAPSV